MSAENNSIKRRKIDGSASKDARCLTDLPKEALIHLATFLAAPSRALFAASLDGSSGSSDENISAIFFSNQLIGSGGPMNFREISAQLAQDHVQKILWEMEALNQIDILDFGKIVKKYVVQLSDDGIMTILLCVDAVNTVKRLKLTNCTNLTGVGLEPLRGSTIIEQIDLSLVGKHQIEEIDPEPPISCEAVLPILDSIISQDGCALKHLQFPDKWQRAEEQQYVTFITRYDQMLRSRSDVCCLQCNESLAEGRWIHTYYRSQKYTCYECLKHYCHACQDDDAYDVLPCCQECGRMYCQQCERMNCCEINDRHCGNYFCVDCVEAKECALCTSSACKQCGVSEDAGIECFGGCDRYLCTDCLLHNEHWPGDLRRDCECCGKSFCPDCEYERCEEMEGYKVCKGCVQLGYPVLAKYIKLLKSEVKGLKEQIEKMKIEQE